MARMAWAAAAAGLTTRTQCRPWGQAGLVDDVENPRAGWALRLRVGTPSIFMAGFWHIPAPSPRLPAAALARRRFAAMPPSRRPRNPLKRRKSSDITRWQEIAPAAAPTWGSASSPPSPSGSSGCWLDRPGRPCRAVDSERQKVGRHGDARYLGTVINVTLNILLVVGILGYFGIQTTTFAALFAAAAAWPSAWPGPGCWPTSPAGSFIILRPIKVGFRHRRRHHRYGQGSGLFASAINTPDNVMTLVGNGKIFGDTIQNFSVNPHRRVDLKAQLAGAADCGRAIALLKSIAAVPNVPPLFGHGCGKSWNSTCRPGPAVRPYCQRTTFYFDTNKVIRERLARQTPGADALPGGVRHSKGSRQGRVVPSLPGVTAPLASP